VGVGVGDDLAVAGVARGAGQVDLAEDYYAGAGGDCGETGDYPGPQAAGGLGCAGYLTGIGSSLGIQ
jgi:hypothetical protein